MTVLVCQTQWSRRLPADAERGYLATMPAPVRAEISRYRRWEDRQARLLGKLLLRHALAGLTGEPEVLSLERLERSETGKPFISGVPDFNISHSGSVVVVAVADGGMVGIDVEMIRPVRVDDFSGHLPELAHLDVGDPAERLNRFYSCWTKKEAVLKAEGAGLLIPLEQVMLTGTWARLREREWCLTEIHCGTEYCCHLATSHEPAGCRMEVVNF